MGREQQRKNNGHKLNLKVDVEIEEATVKIGKTIKNLLLE